jgi:Reverse transcriptase (RNA-dependent DNA polymerase)
MGNEKEKKIVRWDIYKWKARLNIDGGKQEHGINYWETYAPVAQWSTIRVVLTIALQKSWCTKQLDFVQAYPQAPVETDLYMSIPKGYQVNESNDKYALKIINNIYGQKQAGRVWNEYLIVGLKELGYIQSEYDMSLLWKKTCILVIYTDDTIITGPNASEVDKQMKEIGNKFTITTNDNLEDFLGVHIEVNDNTMTFTQPQLVQSILNDLQLNEKSKSCKTPSVTNQVLHAHKDSEEHTEQWHYRSVIGKLNYLEKSSRPDISYAVHQCARFCEHPKVEHTIAVKRIGRYLLGTKDKGIMYTPKDESIVCYTDASFLGDFQKDIAEHEITTAYSRTGYIIKYGGCPIVWSSKMQTEITHSATEAEYVALSQSLREVTALMHVLDELKNISPEISINIPVVHCKVFEDNSGAIEMARVPKMRPRTKHLNAKYHHFRDAVARKKITIQYINTKSQQADILTKSVIVELFTNIRKLIMGW